MATITPAAVYPVSGIQVTTPPYSGTFIPTVWSSKLNVKFYAATTFGDVSNTNWEGDVKSMGDKVIINNIPNITIAPYTIGGTLTIQVPVPEIIELQIDKGYYFAVNVSDVLEYQAQPNLMDMFTTDASNQMKIAVDQECFLSVVTGAHPNNVGNAAGKLSGAYKMGADDAPIELVSGPSGTPANSLNILGQITAMASILDEQNVPETDRFLILTPYERNLLMSTNLAQAQFMGDATSIVRNGKIGRIDRFDVYVSNLLPKAALGEEYPTVVGAAGAVDATAVKRHALFAGHKSAWTFAAQINKVETLPNHLDFGQIVRGLVVYGRKVVKPEGMVVLQAKG
jgi:hypothetical protein